MNTEFYRIVVALIQRGTIPSNWNIRSADRSVVSRAVHIVMDDKSLTFDQKVGLCQQSICW